MRYIRSGKTYCSECNYCVKDENQQILLCRCDLDEILVEDVTESSKVGKIKERSQDLSFRFSDLRKVR